MKIRAGFVSNSSSSCFVCGTSIGEDGYICDNCFQNNVIKDFLTAIKPHLNITEKEAMQIYEKYMRGTDNED